MKALTFAELASKFRRYKNIEKVGANGEEVDSLIANLLDRTNSISIEKTADLVNQIYEISKSEKIPPAEVPAYINQKIEEKHRLEEEIQEARAILDQENIEIQNINEYKKSKEQLKKYGLSTVALDKLVSVLRSFDEMGHDPHRIFSYYKHVKSLNQKEWRLRNYCKLWESRAARYKEILPLCEQIDSFGMGFPELVVFRSAVFRIAEMENLSYGEAAYVLMARIDMPEKIADMEKQLNDTIMKVQMVNLVSARHNDAIMALARLQFQGITENQILNLCKVIKTNSHNLNGEQSMNSSIF